MVAGQPFLGVLAMLAITALTGMIMKVGQMVAGWPLTMSSCSDRNPLSLDSVVCLGSQSWFVAAMITY